jgi:predicted Fe-Mo cluster-binding NifX family protein
MNSVRLAIATSDGTTVAGHLARAASFLVMEIEQGRVVAAIRRDRGTDQCGNHKTFTELLAGCQDVICCGISEAAENLLAAHGTRTIVLAKPMGTDQALDGYLAGTLETTAARICLCH